MDDIGTPRYNLLLDLLKCQVKHPNQNLTNSMNDDDNAEKRSKTVCTKVERAYSACHAGIKLQWSQELWQRDGELTYMR